MKRLSTSWVLAGLLAVPMISLADDDIERDTSVYDKHPECTERAEETASNPKCTPQDGAPNRKGIATRNGQPKGSNQGDPGTSPQSSGR